MTRLLSLSKLGKINPTSVRARKVAPYKRDVQGLVAPAFSNGYALNQPESIIFYALQELKINFSAQVGLAGGSVLGGARADFLLPDYRMNLEYHGPQHDTTYGAARDLLRNITVKQRGYRVIQVYEADLKRIKPRLLEIVGRPIGQ